MGGGHVEEAGQRSKAAVDWPPNQNGAVQPSEAASCGSGGLLGSIPLRRAQGVL
jgi:hypothetical protein